MNPVLLVVLAMTRGLDVQLWVGWMEIKVHFVSQDVIAFFGAMGYQMRRPLRNLGLSDCLGWCLLWK